MMGAEAARDHVSALPDDGGGLDDQRQVRGWICGQPGVLQRIAVQHDPIRVSTGRKGIELAPGAQRLRHHARCSAEFPIRVQVQPPTDPRRPSFVLKPAGLFDRDPILEVPAPGGALPRGSVMSACGGG